MVYIYIYRYHVEEWKNFPESSWHTTTTLILLILVRAVATASYVTKPRADYCRCSGRHGAGISEHTRSTDNHCILRTNHL